MKTTQACFRLWAAVSITILLAVNVTTHGQSADAANAITPIRFENVPITTAIESLARLARINYLLDPKFSNSFFKADGTAVLEPTITTNWTGMTAKQMLAELLKENGLFLVEDPVTSIAEISRTNRITNPVDAKLLGSDTNQVTPIRFQDVPIDTALDTLIRLGHLDVTLDPKVAVNFDPISHMIHPQPTVSIYWVNVTARQAIIALCENYDLIIVKNAATGTVQIKLKE
jgi:hypothetical protein